MTDNFVQEAIPDDAKFLTAPEFEPYRVTTATGLGDCIEGLENFAIGYYKKGENLIRNGASLGDPYSIYALYKMYASENDFGIQPDRDTAWYYLICAAVSFFTSLLYEESSINMLNLYHEAFDNENHGEAIAVIDSGIDEDCTPLVEHKTLLKYVFLYMMQYNPELQKKKIIEYLRKFASSPREFTLLHLFLVHNDDPDTGIAIIRSDKFREYASINVRDCLLLYNQSGSFGPSGTSVGIYNSVPVVLCWLIALGRTFTPKNDQNIDRLVMELYTFCSMQNMGKKEEFGEVLEDEFNYLVKLKPLIKGIIGYLYLKGYYLTRNLKKAEELIDDCINDDTKDTEDESVEWGSLRNYLVYVGKYKILKKRKETIEAVEYLDVISKFYTEEELEERGEAVMPIDYFIAGYIQKNLHNDKEKAAELYEKGLNLDNQGIDYGKIMEYVAFKRKCQSNLEKTSNKKSAACGD